MSSPPLICANGRVIEDSEQKVTLQRCVSSDQDACYERTLISGNSRFDQYYYQNSTSSLSKAIKNL